MDKDRFDVIMFDLGGVLIRLDGVQRMMAWTGLSNEDLWRRWLASPGVRGFESGRVPAEVFAKEMVAEFNLPLSPANFLAEYEQWPMGLFPGGVELLESLKNDYRLVSLSNTNALHWQMIVDNFDLARRFEVNLPSHLTGFLKPDVQAFQHAIGRLAHSPERILFMDDNQINVEGAREAGIVAYQAHGVEGATAVLKELGILTPSKG